MERVVKNQPGLTLLQGAVDTVVTENGRALGVRLETGEEIAAKAVVLTTGTFLNGMCHRGEESFAGARHGDRSVAGLSDSSDPSVPIRRFKTGTTPRIALSSIDLGKVGIQKSEPDAGPFSLSMLPFHHNANCWTVTKRIRLTRRIKSLPTILKEAQFMERGLTE